MPLPTLAKSSGTLLQPAEAIQQGLEAWERVVEWTARVGGKDLTSLPYWMARPLVSYLLARAEPGAIIGVQANGSLNAAFENGAPRPAFGDLSELDFLVAVDSTDSRLLLSHGIDTYPDVGGDPYRSASLLVRHHDRKLPSVVYRCAGKAFPIYLTAGETSQLVAQITLDTDKQIPHDLALPALDAHDYRVLDFVQTRVIAPLKPLRIDSFHETLDSLIAVTNSMLRQLGIRDGTFPVQALRLPTVTQP